MTIILIYDNFNVFFMARSWILRVNEKTNLYFSYFGVKFRLNIQPELKIPRPGTIYPLSFLIATIVRTVPTSNVVVLFARSCRVITSLSEPCAASKTIRYFRCNSSAFSPVSS